MSISVGDYIIINDADKPCTRLIALVTEANQEKDFVRAQYICERVNMRECQGRLSNARLVSDFGVEIIFNDHTVYTEQVRPSIATYPDGEPRNWQPSGESPEQKLFRGWWQAKKMTSTVKQDSGRECWGDSCCCSCQFQAVDRSHPCTDGKMITEKRGWICFLPELEGDGISGWPEHGGCECYQRRENRA